MMWSWTLSRHPAPIPVHPGQAARPVGNRPYIRGGQGGCKRGKTESAAKRAQGGGLIAARAALRVAIRCYLGASGVGPVFLNRVVQRREGLSLIRALPTATMDCAEISGSFWTRKAQWKSAESFDYPEYDVCLGAFRDGTGAVRQFDMIIADQVWEHIDRPYAATRAVHEMLRPGGYFYVAVPFYVRYHPYPVDCSRWTARGLKNLLVEGGFDETLVRVEQWGNLQAAQKDCARRWAKHVPGEDDLRNDPAFPIVSWALGRKAP